MSYCVECGVELDRTAEKCPLCSTPVVNPNITQKAEAPLPFPLRTEIIPESVKRRFSAFIISMVLLVPNIVCLLVNLIIDRSNLWTWWVNSTSLLVWTVFVLPFLIKKRHPWLIVTIDAVAVIGYAYVFYFLERDGGWFQFCAVPTIVITAFLIEFLIEWKKRYRPDWPIFCIGIFTALIVESLSFELLLRHCTEGIFRAPISLIIAACCLAIIVFFISVATNKRLQHWIDKKFFVD